MMRHIRLSANVYLYCDAQTLNNNNKASHKIVFLKYIFKIRILIFLHQMHSSALIFFSCPSSVPNITIPNERVEYRHKFHPCIHLALSMSVRVTL
jgi:hypothetical protein